MRKFVMPLLAAAFLAVAGSAAIPQTANAASVHVGIHGPGWGIHYRDGHWDRGPRWKRGHRGHRGRHARHLRRACDPVYRKQWHWTRHGWKRKRVLVGYHCPPIPRRWRHR